MPLSMFLPLRVAVPLFVAIVFTALALGHGYFSYQQLSADLQRDVTHHLRTVMAMMQQEINDGYRQGDMARVESAFGQISLDRFVTRVVVADAASRILLSGAAGGRFNTLEELPAYHGSVGQRVVDTGTSRILTCDGEQGLCGYFRVNLYGDVSGSLRGRYGLLFLEYNLQKHRGEELQRVVYFVASLVASILLAAVLLWIFLHRVVTRRVDDLQYAAQVIANGDFSARSRVDGRDELGRLAAEINKMARDIQQRQEQLQNNERRYRLLFDNAGDAMFVHPLEGASRFVEVNAYACQMLGYTREELLDMTPAELDDPLYSANVPDVLARLEREGHAVFNTAHRRKDGSAIQVEVAAHCFIDGERTMVLSIARPLTSRMALERELHHFKATLDMSNDYVLMFEPEQYRCIYSNHGAESALHFTGTELEGVTLFELFPELESGELKEQLQALYHDDLPMVRFEVEVAERDSGSHPVDATLQYVSLPTGAGRFVLIARDVTEQKRTREALARSNRALHTLSSSNMVLVRARDEKQLLDDICRAVVQEGGYLLGWIGFAEEVDGEKRVVPQASAGVELDYLKEIRVLWDESELGNGPVGRAIRDGKPTVTQDVLHDPDFRPWREAALRHGYRSVVGLPLRDDDGVYGCLAIYAGDKDAFTGEELKLLRELAGDLSFGISVHRTRSENIYLQESRLQAEQQLRENLVETIMAMASALEKRDPYTAGHQQRVARLATAIAERMALSDDTVEGIRFGALIHDIGKIYIPAEILNRPGRLSENEFNLIKAHPRVGYEIIQDVNFPWPVAQMVRQHHERLDGSGYPDGLRGEEILLEARILAVADVVEAITSHRPYRPGLGLDKAIEEIEKSRDRWYDGAVVDACVALLQDGEWEWEKD